MQEHIGAYSVGPWRAVLAAAPQQRRRWGSGTHFDVMPTLMDFLGLSAWTEHYLGGACSASRARRGPLRRQSTVSLLGSLADLLCADLIAATSTLRGVVDTNALASIPCYLIPCLSKAERRSLVAGSVRKQSKGAAHHGQSV